LGKLKEILVSFKYRRTGVRIIDKLVYNLRYYSVYKKFIKKYLKENNLPSLVHVHVPMKAGNIARWIKRKWKIPYMLSEHSSSYEIASPDFFGKRSLYYRQSVKKIFEGAAVITNVSAKMGERMRSLIGLNRKIEVVHNVVDDALFFYKPIAISVFRFIHVSGMSHQKNIEGIIKSFYKLSSYRMDWELWLVGPVDNTIVSLINSLGLSEKIICKGEVSYSVVAQCMQQSLALVMFSRHENFPCVVIEALCCGLPVIASDTGGISEAVNESNGLLVPSENEDALITALQKMMDNYTNYDRKNIGELARTKYRFSVAADQFINFYDQVISSD
jgi:glycosyltransferase involved in cell wall biosynthesis